MKKLIKTISLIYLALLGCAYSAHAQCWNNTPQTTTTDWRNYPSQSQNNWNWTDTNLHDFFLKKYDYIVTGGPRTYVGTAPIQLRLPYYCLMPLGTAGCNNSNTNALHNITPDSMDIFPEDGWELVVKNFGYCPNATNCLPANAVENPYFAIYNRRTGRMKVFIMIASKYDKQGMYIEIKFSGYKRAIFTHVSPYAKALPDYDSSLYYKAPNHYELTDHYWVWADVQMGYDFCNCTDNHVTEIAIKPWLLQQASVDLVGEGGIRQNIFSNNGGTIIGPSGTDKSSLFDALNNGYKAGQTASLIWQGYRDKVNNTVDQNISPIVKTSMALAWWYETQKNDPLYSMATTAYKIQRFTDVLGFSTDSAFKANIGAGKIDNVNKVFGGIKNIASQLPHVGWIIGLVDFFSQGGGAKPETVATTAPISFDVNLRFKGSITELSAMPPINFYMPGSPTQTNISKKPFYNNTLGVISILKQPYLNHVNYISTPAEFVQGACGYTPSTGGNGFYDLKYKHYKLSEPIKYVLNPASDLEVVSIDAAYILEYTKKAIDPLFLTRSDFVSNQQRFSNFLVNAQIPALFDDPNLWVDSNVLSRMENHSDMVVDYYMNNFDTANINDNSVVFRARTKYVPLNCFENVSFILQGGAASKPEYAPRVMVKMFIKMKHKNDPSVEPVTQIIQWDLGSAVNSTDIGPPLFFSPKYESSCSDVGAAGGIYPIYPKRVLTPTFPTIFYGTKTRVLTTGSVISQNLYARDSIIVESGVTINSGVVLHAGKEVIVHPDNQYQDVILRTGILNINQCQDADISSMHANDDEINGVCQNPVYKGRIVGNKTGDILDTPEEEEEAFMFRLFPNPSNGITYASYILSFENTDPISIYITDLFGRELLQPLQNQYQIGEQAVKIDMTSFEAGIYFVNLKVGDKRYTERLILTK